jgi:hypothetical protein
MYKLSSASAVFAAILSDSSNLKRSNTPAQGMITLRLGAAADT